MCTLDARVHMTRSELYMIWWNLQRAHTNYSCPFAPTFLGRSEKLRAYLDISLSMAVPLWLPFHYIHQICLLYLLDHLTCLLTCFICVFYVCLNMLDWMSVYVFLGVFLSVWYFLFFVFWVCMFVLKRLSMFLNAYALHTQTQT